MKDPTELLEGLGGKEYLEEARASGDNEPNMLFTNYPDSLLRYRLHVEGYQISIEEPYFWVLHYLRYFCGYPYVDKITDVFAAAENSAFFGVSQQRLGLQEDKVSQYLATIGKMVKELFQLVRELRVLDERLDYYTDSYTNSKSAESAEITLKGIWVDMVEQGAKNPASVYGMAREVQFTTLPDLFFSTHPQKQEDVDEVVERERGQFNRKVREVLKRKLRTFLTWKEHTYEELKNRRKFTLKYLRQHYEIIRMYMAWVKPYLRNIQRLHMDQSKMKTPDLLAAFETSMIEVEILAHKPTKSGKTNSIVDVHFLWRTSPTMSYQTEGYQRGPLHIGRVEMSFRAYSWTNKQIEIYKKYKEREDFKLMELIDSSVKAAMEALGDELLRYLEEAGEDTEPKKEIKENSIQRALSPYTSIFKGFNELFKSFKTPKTNKPKKGELFSIERDREQAKNYALSSIWTVYHHFKKHHGMLNW
jgi:hypothetical protein